MLPGLLAGFRQETALVLVLLPLSVVVARSPVQWLLLVLPLFLMLIVELLNSAIESVVDRFGGEIHELSARAKDMGSAAVFISLVMISITWFTIIIENYF